MIKVRQNKPEVNSEFKPIKITFEINSEKELCNLWLRLNMSVDDVNNAYDKYPTLVHGASSDSVELWNELDNLIRNHNLRK